MLIVCTTVDSLLCALAVVLVSDKDRELGEAQVEIKALRLSERLREKAVEEVIIDSSYHSFCFYRMSIFRNIWNISYSYEKHSLTKMQIIFSYSCSCDK